MELDRTRIAIRERGYFDILDLALRITREQFWPIALATTLGAGPFFLLNYLLFDRAEWFAPFDSESVTPEIIAGWFSYLFFLTVLVLIEIPLATAPLTLYLGQKLFLDKVDPKTGQGAPNVFDLSGAGNTHLVPEQATTKTAGVIFTPL